MSRALHSMRPVELKRLRELEAAGAPFLSWHDEHGAWSFYVLDERAARVFALGRAPGSDIEIADARVSSLHAELRRTGDHWLIEDQALSTNGTFVNGARVVQRRLRAQDSVLVGDTRITFHAPGRGGGVTTTVKRPRSSPSTSSRRSGRCSRAMPPTPMHTPSVRGAASWIARSSRR